MGYTGDPRNARVSTPTVDEVIDFADSVIEKISDTTGAIRAWYEATIAERLAKWIAYRDADVEVEGGTLIVGNWYDVTVKGGWKGETIRTWRNCRYVGRSGSEKVPLYAFERWGAKAATDKWARGQIDSVGSGLGSITPIEVDPLIVEKAKAQADAIAEMTGAKA